MRKFRRMIGDRPLSVLVVVAFEGRQEWELELSFGLRRVREVLPSSGLFSRSAVDVLKRMEDCVERVREGGLSLGWWERREAPELGLAKVGSPPNSGW